MNRKYFTFLGITLGLLVMFVVSRLLQQSPLDTRLARESAKLDTTEERALANESYVADVAAPEY